MVISFIAGIMVCCLILFGIKTVIPIRAATDNTSATSENLTQSFIDLLPDIEKIYHDSLTMPFRKAESKIYDKDIAQYYKELIDSAGLGEPGDTKN